jgi:hypothetical protein
MGDLNPAKPALKSRQEILDYLPRSICGPVVNNYKLDRPILLNDN